ncbi:hypothetical protein BbINS_02523 [Bartonella bacilliformis INS]|uniref:Uncharacterized protein n=2 Tax=Bartonella bacilliformis TaxID=774 RepID=A1USA3_BARBK|nr:hypothetical protein BARBAKC583_0541 [Bartonella bacilliformis KC583]EKS44778.1 hypothetical protein BbINS_02523 [Bartonella bacilliformis INS]
MLALKHFRMHFFSKNIALFLFSNQLDILNIVCQFLPQGVVQGE